MTELFDIISAVNRLKDQVIALNKRVDFICKYPSLIGNVKYIDELTACKMLKVSRRSLRRMRSQKEIDFIQYHRKFAYSLRSIATDKAGFLLLP
jgi:hypothetical protein